ncbi:porin [Burkholderia sp. Ac-20384]|uniref:Outer membrane protein (Porin) n=2 Tax=Burkholderia lata (strain ATCC 17760 / DSM 23089 / LMG 22485 / NCIMB 9086 / R18194 / 383) TaxID=482957 RepID=Q38ZZ1_BURL3|nr:MULTISPECIES: porin [Burkholderia]ABB13225.1 outer membrane protein (porin) [Burkholderia lata]KAF1035117.1 MAG: Outer membrane porin protein [Burkholderia lata]MBN3824990.1 porin [Burkholderia sp. Ac-20384]VWB26234.1 porin [Burkholderia lata]
MNKTLIVAAAAASFATVAHAQSSVTLYGVLDAGITYQSNVQTASGQGKSRFSMGSGIDQSRFGLRGSEDLGGGLKAIFTLESGFNIGNGKFANGNGGMFNRQAFVGLSSQYGTVTLGKQYDATQDYLAPLTATGSWGGTYFAHPLNNDRLSTNGDVALNNTIKYTSVNYAGLQFGGTYSFSNSTNFANNRAYSAGLSYQYQGLKLGAAYSQANNAGLSTSGAVNPSVDTNGNAFGIQGRTRTYGIAAAYAFGPAQVGAAWTQSRLDNQTNGLGTLRADNYEINAKYNLTPALGLGAAYTYTNAKQNGNSTHWNQFGVQADYFLSKRTDVYAQAVYQRGTKGAGLGASIYNGDINAYPSSKVSQTAATVGLRHRF